MYIKLSMILEDMQKESMSFSRYTDFEDFKKKEGLSDAEALTKLIHEINKLKRGGVVENRPSK